MYKIDERRCRNYIESKNGIIICNYDIVPHYFVGIVESKDRVRVKRHCVLANNLAELEDYINSLEGI